MGFVRIRVCDIVMYINQNISSDAEGPPRLHVSRPIIIIAAIHGRRILLDPKNTFLRILTNKIVFEYKLWNGHSYNISKNKTFCDSSFRGTGFINYIICLGFNHYSFI